MPTFKLVVREHTLTTYLISAPTLSEARKAFEADGPNAPNCCFYGQSCLDYSIESIDED